jgi:hypothetical protein
MKHPTVTGSIRDGDDVIGRDVREPLTPSPESFPMSDARMQSRDAPVAIEPLPEVAARALATRRYTILAALAAGRVTAPTVLDTSAALLAVGRDSELVATVTFVPAPVSSSPPPRRTTWSAKSSADRVSRWHARRQISRSRIPSAIRPSRPLRYTRTRPAYEQDVHFEDAAGRLGELAGA